MGAFTDPTRCEITTTVCVVVVRDDLWEKGAARRE